MNNYKQNAHQHLTDCNFPFGSEISEKKWFKVLCYVITPLLLLILWSFFANYLNKPYLIPTPQNTFKLFLAPTTNLLSQGSLLSNTIISLLRILIGFSIAIIIAVPLGLLLGGIAPLKQLFEPLIEVLRPICPIAWLPIVIAVFKLTTIPEFIGIGYTGTILDQLQIGMIFIIFWGAFFPIFINTLDGVANIKDIYIRLAVMQGARKIQIFTKVVIPNALPQIFTGLRQGAGLSWFVIIASEILPGSEAGIGYLLTYAADMSAMNIVIASIIIIGSIGAILNYSMIIISRKFLFWQGKEL